MESKYKLPISFKVGSCDYKVKVCPFVTSPDSGDEILGLNDPFNETILLSSSLEGMEITEKEMNKTFHHELIHAILTEMGEYELNENERFVEGFARLLFQYNNTRRFAK